MEHTESPELKDEITERQLEDNRYPVEPEEKISQQSLYFPSGEDHDYSTFNIESINLEGSDLSDVDIQENTNIVSGKVRLSSITDSLHNPSVAATVLTSGGNWRANQSTNLRFGTGSRQALVNKPSSAAVSRRQSVGSRKPSLTGSRKPSLTGSRKPSLTGSRRQSMISGQRQSISGSRYTSQPGSSSRRASSTRRLSKSIRRQSTKRFQRDVFNLHYPISNSLQLTILQSLLDPVAKSSDQLQLGRRCMIGSRSETWYPTESRHLSESGSQSLTRSKSLNFAPVDIECPTKSTNLHLSSIKDVSQPAMKSLSQTLLLSEGSRVALTTAWSQTTSKSDGKPEGETVLPNVVKCTVTITLAIPKAEVEKNKEVQLIKKKPMKAEPTKAQNYYHLEFSILPDGTDPIKIDLADFGLASKVYMESDTKVLIPWNDDERIWLAWKHQVDLPVTRDMLLKLTTHIITLQVWDSKEKVSPKARFDRPRGFRVLRQKGGNGSEGEDLMKTLVLTQKKLFKNVQPKASSSLLNRKMTVFKKEQSEEVINNLITLRLGERKYLREDTMSHNKEAITPSIEQHISLTGRTEGPRPISERKLCPDPESKASSAEEKLKMLVEEDKDESITNLTKRKFNNKKGNIKLSPRDKKREVDLHMEPTVVINLDVKPLVAGSKAITNKLEKPCPTILDGYFSLSLQEPLLSDELQKELNPLVICILSVTSMPSTPISIADLEHRCNRVTCQYQFLDQPCHRTLGREHGANIYFNDVNVILAGMVNAARLREYLLGPALEIEVHDRDRKLEDQLQIPALFGAEPEDSKLSNVGLVSCKRTLHNPFTDTNNSWDPYGVAKVSLTELLDGKRVLNLTVPIQVCRVPEPSGSQPVGLGSRILGVVGAVDGPQDVPLAVGHYLESNAQLKLRVEIAYPLSRYPVQETTDIEALNKQIEDQELLDIEAAKRESEDKEILDIKTVYKDGVVHETVDVGTMVHRSEIEIVTKEIADSENVDKKDFEVTDKMACPFGRIIYIFDYRNQGFLQELMSEIKEVNRDGLCLESLPKRTSPLHHLKFFKNDSSRLDIITGFHVMDGNIHLFVLEGLRDGGIRRLWEKLPARIMDVEKGRLDVWYSSDLSFHNRLYTDLDLSITPIRLHETLQTITKQPLLYVRDMVPPACLQGTLKLHSLCSVQKLRDAVHNDLFPTAEMVTLVSREFGVPLSGADSAYNVVSEINPYPSPAGTVSTCLSHPKHRHPLVTHKVQEERKRERAVHMDFTQMNIEAVQRASKRLQGNRREMVSAFPTNSKHVYPYSIQTLNSIEQAKELVRAEIAKDPKYHFTYSGKYMSAKVDPVDVEKERKLKMEMSKADWRTFQGFQYPGFKTSLDSNRHRIQLSATRREELHSPWKEHRNVDTGRGAWKWQLRKKDFDLHSLPPHQAFPTSIHLTGEKADAEQLEAVQNFYEDWRSKLVVANTWVKCHRCGVGTEQYTQGPKASNTLDRLKGLRKDTPAKYTCKTPLSSKFRRLIPCKPESQLENGNGFSPGTDKFHSLQRQAFPRYNMEHHKYAELKGHDFNSLWRPKSYVYQPRLKPLTKEELRTHLFTLGEVPPAQPASCLLPPPHRGLDGFSKTLAFPASAGLT